MTRLSLAGALAVLSLAPLPAPTPASCLGPVLQQLKAAKTRQDSLNVSKPSEAKAASGDACAKLIVGYTIGMTSTPSEDAPEWQERQRAAQLLESVQRDFGDEPRFYMALAVLTYHRQSWTDAFRIFDRAMDKKASGPDPLTPREVAAIYYMRGLMHQDLWRDWRSFGHLISTAGGQLQCAKFTDQVHSSFSSGSEDNSWLIGFNTVCPTQMDSVLSSYYQPDSKLKQEEFLALEAAFDSAATADTTYEEPIIARVSEYVYGRMWEKAEPMADLMRHRFPDDYRSWAISGLVQHELRRDSLASLQFGQALIRMNDTVLAVYDNITDLLDQPTQEWYAHADPMMRSRAVGAFWNSLDPLYVTPYNERKLEHYARVTAAELMFSSPALKEHGWSSFAGKIWIRYGRPVYMKELSGPAEEIVFWHYGSEAAITFQRGKTRTLYRGTDDAIDQAHQLAAVRPQGYITSNFIDSLELLDHQLVKFRSADGTGQVLLYAPAPGKYSNEARAAVVLMDAQFQPIAEWRGVKPQVGGIHQLFRPLGPGQYSITVELWDAATRHLGRVRDTLSFRPDTAGTLQLSDILVAQSIEAASTVNKSTAGREQLTIDPLYGVTLTQNNPLALYWEIYGLKGGDKPKYNVTVQVQNAQKQPMLARLLGVTGQREGLSKISYEGQRQQVNGRVAEWLSLSSDLTPGAYKVVVTVEDATTKVTKMAERGIIVK